MGINKGFMKGKDRQRVCEKDSEITDRKRERKKNIGRRNEAIILSIRS